jgi:transposase
MHPSGYAKQLRAWDARRRQIKALHERGMSLEQIARRYGISRQRVGQLVKAKQ